MKRFLLLLGLFSALLLLAWLLVPGLRTAQQLSGKALGIAVANSSDVLSALTTAPGFRVERYYGAIRGPRGLAASHAGLIVSSPSEGAIYRLIDSDQNGRAERHLRLIDQLNRPSGLAIHNSWLYVAEADAIGRIAYDPISGKTQGSYQRIVNDLPSGANHWRRVIHFGPDGWLYLAIGSSCNVCIEEDPRRGTIMRFHADGGAAEIYATGLRNSAGFDWAPWDKQLYATDNGRDWLGDDEPPDELNRITRGSFYGWPYSNGFGKPDPDYGHHPSKPRQPANPPAHGFRPHNAALGMIFNRSSKLPAEYQRSAFVALHGSWNRSIPDGYKVVSLHWNEDGSMIEKDLLSGFLSPESKILGRPAEITQGADGSLYISDDHADTLYRVYPTQ
ncbi:MAG: PQQ-dependent sugar dehydrogenase [Gammaproteobacteria bacterium]|nr:PQQ-dependent sugar dehydrogenase [Gammaproteobacteria bacterium]MBQ0839549.1 PQQ-dependent sugar dehydrogenase [Gammaproteobacteria bacterium]